MNTQAHKSIRTATIWRIIGWGTLAFLLLLPALAMQVTDEVNWTSSDFVIGGFLLATLGLGIEAAVRFLRGWRARLIAGGIVLFVFMVIWAELAVGLFGSPFAGS